MRLHLISALGCGLAAALFISLPGCTSKAPASSKASPAVVVVSYPVERKVTDFAIFTGRTEAVKSVEIRARVDGYLVRMPFKEGADVKAGDLLFQIDPRPYQATYDQAVAQVALAKARITQANADYSRASELAKTPGAISKQDVDRYSALQGEAAAQLQAAEATAQSARLNLEFTNVVSPIDGMVSRYYVTEGNLVQSGQMGGGGTLLTKIVSIDPMYAIFSVDEQTLLHARQLIREGKAKSARDAEINASLGLADDNKFPYQGIINFVDNQVDPRTGTLLVRAVFPNKDKILSPGLMARVRVPIGEPHDALLVSERAIDTDQGHKILYVVNDKNEVMSRPIRVGALHAGMRVIESGVQPNERVIVNGLQRVRPGVVVDPKLAEMPFSASDPEAVELSGDPAKLPAAAAK
ncbi:MAG TPA: efflux RND transporter periplasmic adaptor subunit [Lacipirellulaceae bacterium]|nr:efflux RND transporter periplasmic adaptor subunit [Lacipirellulaceae bacterium]